MKTKFLLFGTVLLQLAALPAHAKQDTFLFGQEEPLQLVINNRILAKVNGKAISVVDIMKKMDMLFYRQFPEYTSSVQARFQFYQVNWKHFLQEAIDKELILADAEEVKLPISAGDIRQELETLFGPNIIANLDKAGLTYEDASKMVQADIAIRRMVYIKVNSKALKAITPLDVRKAYEKYTKENIKPDMWNYQVVSIRDKDVSKGAEAANLAYELLIEKTPLSELSEKIKSNPLFSTSTINVSEEYQHTEKEISPAYLEILSTLSSGTQSKPIPLQSRSDKSTVFRLFYLKEMQKGGIPPISEVENTLRDKLLQDEINAETENYLKKLRQHFDVQESYLKQMIAEDFQPFSLK